MKKILTILIAMSISLSGMFIFSGCGDNEDRSTGEFSATQEEILKENKEIEKILREKGSDFSASDYKVRLVALDKVDNKYKFSKDDAKYLEIINADGSVLVKIKDKYYAWGRNDKDLLTVKEDEQIKKELLNYMGPYHDDAHNVRLLNFSNVCINITKGVVEYYVPEDVETLRMDSVYYPAGITKDGKACIWKNKDYILDKPVKYIEHKDKIIDVLRFKNTIYYITSKGEVYSNEEYFGQNNSEFFQKSKNECNNIYKISNDIKAESFCRGSIYQLAIKDKNGDFYIYKANDEGKNVFEKIEIPEKIIKAESGYEHIYFLTEKGNIYSYGRNGEPYINEVGEYNYSMEKLNLGFNVKDLCVDFQNVIFKDNEGNLYGIGPTYSKIFINEEIPTEEYLYGKKQTEAEMVMVPQKIDIPDKVTDFKGGFSAGICKTESGDLYAFGSNFYGQHLNGTRWSTYKPTKITES